jgi:hypothetical protein
MSEDKKEKPPSIGKHVTDKIEQVKKAATSPSQRNRVQAIIHLCALGLTPKQISEQLNCSQQWVKNVMKSESFQREVDRVSYQLYIKEPQKMFQSIVPKAVSVAYKEMTSKKTSSKVKVDAAFRFIERAYGKPKQEIEHVGTTLKDIYLALDSKKKSPQDIQDAEYTSAEEKISKFDDGSSPVEDEADDEESGSS